MIAKKHTLIINALYNSSLQVSLQKSQLNASGCLLLDPIVLQGFKEHLTGFQHFKEITTPNLFANLYN